ncbi:MAG: cytochrome o ubiquinol oxidase subunit IV [Xanthobacteraceae bacterium]
MSDNWDADDVAPGFTEARAYTVREDIQGYLVGLVLAALLTAASFYVVYTHLIWAPAIPIALVVLAIAQIGVHLVFFLHLTTAPDNTNNVLALAFGVLIVALIIGGSVWIMANLNERMMPMNHMMQMQR